MTESSIQEQLLQLRRDNILDAAVTVIAERGFERTTIKQIAKQAGVADGTLYNYFKNKAAIMTAIVERMTFAERRDIDFAQAAQIDFATFVRTYIPQRMVEMEQDLTTMKVVVAETLNNAELRDDVNERIYAPLFALGEQYARSLIEAGDLQFDDPATVIRLMASPFFGLLMLRLLGDEHIADNWTAYGDALAELLIATLSSQQTSS